MIFTVSLYLALAVCLLGMVWKAGRWLLIDIGPETRDVSPLKRLGALGGGFIQLIFSRRLLTGLGILVRDVLLQVPIFKNSPWRWAMHMAMFYGFMLLVLMHALDESVTAALFADYQSTLNPYFFLRNLLGLIVMAGVVGVALHLRSKILTRLSDRLLIISLVLILLSGFALEATQIVSAPIFDEMVYEYMDEDDEEILQSLGAYWASAYGVVFARPAHAPTDAQLETGAELHEEYCAQCHHRPTAAFVSYPLSRALKPVAMTANHLRLDRGLYYLHFLLSFAALALLPFTKLWHLLATPLNLIMRAARPISETTPAARANRRALGLEACTHCGECSLRCSVAPIYSCLDNPYILPSEKLVALKLDPRGTRTAPTDRQRLAQGSFICSDCYRCTRICPAGVELQDLWQASRADLTAAGFSEPHHWMTCRSAVAWIDTAAEMQSANPQAPLDNPLDTGGSLNLIDRPETFSACVQCTTCTSVCPVVATAEDPAAELDLTPQQIMNLMRLEMIDNALGARMVWKCTTCYMCQEHCPQGVKVADVLNELRNLAARKFANQGENACTAGGTETPEAGGAP